MNMGSTPLDAELELLTRGQLDFLGLGATGDSAKDALALLDGSGGAGGVDDAAGAIGAVEDFDMSFLSDFIMADGEVLPEPESPPLASAASPPMIVSTSSSPDLLYSHAAAVVGAVPALDFVFDAARAAQSSGSSSPSGSTSSSSSADRSAKAGEATEEDKEEDKEENSAESRKARRRAQVAISARRHRSRKKNEMMELRKQVSALNSHLELLRSKHKMLRHDGAVAEWEERAMAQRHKRRQAEALNDQLKRAVFEQRGFVKDLKSVFSSAPMHSTELNMRFLLHTYTRLGKNPRTRFRDFESICTNAKLDMAIQIVTRETDGVLFDEPSITTRQIQAQSNEFGMTTVAVYAFDSLDIDRVFVAACSAILSCGGEWPNYSLKSAQAKVVDSPATHIRYGISDSKYTSDTNGEEIRLEGRGVSYYRVTDKYAVLLWDFVDVDDLYPLKSDTHMKRDVVGAVVVRQERCADGVERVVCRNICTKIHALASTPSPSPSPSPSRTPSPSQDIVRFSQYTLSGAEACGCRVYRKIKDHAEPQLSV